MDYSRKPEPSKLLSCPSCNKGFRYLSKLTRHELMHKNLKPHSCCYCSKTFSLSYNLRVHKRIHTGERPYKCTFLSCNKSFNQSNNLKVHQRTHQTTNATLLSPFVLEILRRKESKMISDTIETHGYCECDSETTLGEGDLSFSYF